MAFTNPILFPAGVPFVTRVSASTTPRHGVPVRTDRALVVGTCRALREGR